ncbi:hypothetical protein HY732_02205 [Candidatus Uhrbacteria bacterium]|nr:hypothetical protein [Candidatus Uhrbacteria bacterium]
MAVPKFLQSALWSYDLSLIDARKHAGTIIPQILNYGTWKQIQWALRTFSRRTLIKYIKYPARGIWREDALVYWTTIYNVQPSKGDYARALFSLTPTGLPPPRIKMSK